MTLGVTPPDGLSLEEALTTLQDVVEPQLLANLPSDAVVKYGGSADSLRNAIKNMSENFLIALIVLFMLMSALFGSMKSRRSIPIHRTSTTPTPPCCWRRIRTKQSTC